MLARGVARSAFRSRLGVAAAAPSSSLSPLSTRRALLRTAPVLSSPDGGGAADANFILHTKEHAQGGGRNELHYAQCDDSVADVVRRRLSD